MTISSNEWCDFQPRFMQLHATGGMLAQGAAAWPASSLVSGTTTHWQQQAQLFRATAAAVQLVNVSPRSCSTTKSQTTYTRSTNMIGVSYEWAAAVCLTLLPHCLLLQLAAAPTPPL
jgi:hypothetical protein